MVSALEIIDTAVKVGLGALISGAAAYLIEKGRRAEGMARDRLSRKNDLLERTAEQIEDFSHVILRFWALMLEFVRARNLGVTLSDKKLGELGAAERALFDAFKELTSAESKLMLLGHVKAQKLLRAYGDAIGTMRRTAYRSNEELTEDQMQAFRSDMLKAREELFVELSSVYKG